MSGYSGTPLLKKLGYRENDSVFLYGPAPEWFLKELASNKVLVVADPVAMWAHAFFTSQAGLQEFMMDSSMNQIEKALWVSWPKKSSGVQTDLTEQIFRDVILPTGWVDIKVAAIDDTWSGLKFTRRKA